MRFRRLGSGVIVVQLVHDDAALRTAVRVLGTDDVHLDIAAPRARREGRRPRNSHDRGLENHANE